MLYFNFPSVLMMCMIVLNEFEKLFGVSGLFSVSDECYYQESREIFPDQVMTKQVIFLIRSL